LLYAPTVFGLIEMVPIVPVEIVVGGHQNISDITGICGADKAPYQLHT